MTQEEKQLLLQDLCGRLPYKVRISIGEDTDYFISTLMSTNLQSLECGFKECSWVKYIGDIKPYLRPISSMTEEERAEMGTAIQKDRIEPYGEIKNFGEDNLLLCTIRQSTNLQDWLNAHHFDYRGLIDLGLAIEAPRDMYETE